MKRLINIDLAKDKWAKEKVKKYGPVVQVADDRPDAFRVVGVKEENVHDIHQLKAWSYWVDKEVIEWTELNPEFDKEPKQLNLTKPQEEI